MSVAICCLISWSRHLSLCMTISLLFIYSHLSYANVDVPETTDRLKTRYIHFLIPGSEGGGWDTTAREAGKSLLAEKIVERVYFENFIGAGGGRALMDLVNQPSKHSNTLMVQSTPLILRNLTGVIEYGFRDTMPISILIAEYQALVVPIDSEFDSINDLIQAIAISPVRNPILGGSSLGSLDHVTLALIAQAGQLPINKLRYVPTDGGGDAMLQLKRGIGVALVSGVGEVIQAYRNNEIKILGITSTQRLTRYPDIPTFIEQGLEVEFANWRGFFATKTTPLNKVNRFKKLLLELNQTHRWQEICQRHEWQPLLIQGDALIHFLEKQEKVLERALKSLAIE